MTDYNSKAHLELIDKQAKFHEQVMRSTMYVTQKNLRDEFAMAALPVFLTYEIDAKTIAEYCYTQADAMMEARK